MYPPYTVIVRLIPCFFCIFLIPKAIVKKHKGKIIRCCGEEWIVSFPTEGDMKAFVSSANRRGYQCGYLVAAADEQAFFIPD